MIFPNGLPDCHQEGCDTIASFRYTWPGHDEAYICAIHSVKAVQIAQLMGFPLQMIPLFQMPEVEK